MKKSDRKIVSENKTYIYFDYQGLTYELSDPVVNNSNYHHKLNEDPNRHVKIRRFLSVYTVPLKDLKVKAMISDPSRRPR